MPAPKSTFLSLLLLTVPFGVKGNTTTTVTLFDVEPASVAGNNGHVVSKASAIGLDPSSGGTVYLEVIAITSLELVVETSITTTVTNNIAPFTKAVIQAESWVYESVPDPSGKFNNYELNCTLGTNGTTGECIEILQFRPENGTSTGSSTITETTTYNGQVVPLYTVTVTGPLQAIPTSTTTSAATILGNPTFNRLLSMIFFVVMLVLGF